MSAKSKGNSLKSNVKFNGNLIKKMPFDMGKRIHYHVRMAVLVSHFSALDFWRKAYPATKAPDPARCEKPHAKIAYREEDIWSSIPPLFTPKLLQPEGGTIHVTVQDSRCRYRSRTHECHVWGDSFPRNAFYQLGKDAFVASPEFVFLQLAQSLSAVQLIALGFELCGFYSFDENGNFGIRERKVPLTTIERLKEFVAMVGQANANSGKPVNRGTRKIERALPYVLERSASPMETLTALLFTLPYRMGGYGIMPPALNAEIKLPPTLVDVAQRHKPRVDFLWEAINFILEFIGQEPHDGKDALLSDRARAVALDLEGFEVMELTNQQVGSVTQFELVVLHVAELLGKRIPRDKLGMLPQRLALRDELYRWNRASGRV